MPETPATEISSVQPAQPAPVAAPTNDAIVPPVPAVPAPAAPEPAAPVAPPEPPAPPVAPPAVAVAPDTLTPPPAPAAIPAAPAAAVTPVAPKVMDPAWPFVGYDGRQPWEASNTPALTQDHKMLSSGSSGREVVELASYLGYLGYGTSISAGQNIHAIYDAGVAGAVQAFCRDYGVVEDPAVRRARTEDTVGPWIWEAIVRATHRKAEAAEVAHRPVEVG